MLRKHLCTARPLCAAALTLVVSLVIPALCTANEPHEQQHITGIKPRVATPPIAGSPPEDAPLNQRAPRLPLVGILIGVVFAICFALYLVRVVLDSPPPPAKEPKPALDFTSVRAELLAVLRDFKALPSGRKVPPHVRAYLGQAFQYLREGEIGLAHRLSCWLRGWFDHHS